MTSHVLFPAIEPEKLPATMSRRILTGLLREEMGFGGVIISDCMEMDAVAKYYGTVHAATTALDAGADIVCISHTAALARETAEKLWQSYASAEGEYAAELERAGERIAAAKRRFTGLPREETHIFKLRESARELLERSFVLLNGPIPPLGERPFFTGCAGIRANLASSEITGTPSFATIMARRFGGSFDVCSNDPDSEEIASIVRKARNASCIVLNTSSALRNSGQLILMLALGKLKKPMVVIAMREPYELRYLPKHAAGIAAWEYSTRCTAAIAHCLTGQLRCTGRMPLGYFPLERINP
jgi:beta-N-acetylhexosaminidase